MLQWIVISNMCVLQPKLEKQGIYGHAFLTLVIIPQCHSFVIFVIKPPFYLPNSSPVEHIPMHEYSIGWHLSCYHLPSQPRLLPYFPLVHVACKFVACFFDNTYVWNLCSYYYDLQTTSWLSMKLLRIRIFCFFLPMF